MSGQKIIFPYYHAVSDVDKPHYNQLYYIKSIAEFKEELDFLLKYFKPISLNELNELIQSGKKPKEKLFHLTFDDGLSECYATIAPILKEKNIPATFFINTDFLDNEKLFYRFKANLLAENFSTNGMLDLSYGNEKELDDFALTMGVNFDDYLKQSQPYLTSSQVQELINDGFTIGGHSLNHPLYNKISLDEQINQTLNSVNFLVDKFNLDYKVFSFPFTDDGVGREFYEKINKELDLTFGTAGIKHDYSAKNLQRISMEENKKGIEIIKSQYLYYFFKKFLGKNKINR